jgi:hypothetical protein
LSALNHTHSLPKIYTAQVYLLQYSTLFMFICSLLSTLHCMDMYSVTSIHPSLWMDCNGTSCLFLLCKEMHL